MFFFSVANGSAPTTVLQISFLKWCLQAEIGEKQIKTF
jgi:hypothetical protein